jgi:hypothetical protein
MKKIKLSREEKLVTELHEKLKLARKIVPPTEIFNRLLCQYEFQLDKGAYMLAVITKARFQIAVKKFIDELHRLI